MDSLIGLAVLTLLVFCFCVGVWVVDKFYDE